MSGWWFPAVKSLEWLLWRWVMAVIRDKTGKKKNSCAIFHLRGADVLPESKLKSVPVRGGVRLCGREIRGELWPGSREEEFTRFFLLLFFQFFFPSFSSYLFESDHYIPILFYLFLLQHFYVSLLHFSLLFFLNIFSFFSLIHTRSSSFSLFSLFLL